MSEMLHTIILMVAMLIELCGVLIVVVTVGKEMYRIVFIYRFDFEKTEQDMTINNGFANALEVLLAAEILKTLTIRTTSQLIEVAALVAIRIFLNVIIHWEINLKKKHTEAIQEEKDVKEKALEGKQ